jgi:hypothetical protein
MDQKWFLANKTNWHQRTHVERDTLPTEKEVIPYLTKIVLYDVHVALGVAGLDVVAALNVFQSSIRIIDAKLILQDKVVKVHHWITDNELNPAVAEKIFLAMTSLLKGSLLDAVSDSCDCIGFDKGKLFVTPTVYRHYCHPWEGSFERRYRKMVDEYSGQPLTYESDLRVCV